MSTTSVYLNQIATAIPKFECHSQAADFLLNRAKNAEERDRLQRVIARLGINKRYSVLNEAFGPNGFYAKNQKPSLRERMEKYREFALPLACEAASSLLKSESNKSITHIILTSCTGFYAPGLDIEILQNLGLSPNTNRSLIGFMGCYAAIPALRLAHDTVLAHPEARVLVVSVELCSLHFRQEASFDQLVSFLLFADGCAAALVTSEKQGLRLEGFYNATVPNTLNHMRWTIVEDAFVMKLDEEIPMALHKSLCREMPFVLHNQDKRDFTHWAIHPGGQAILSAAEEALEMPVQSLTSSRQVLRDFGNMSSPTVLFVLKDILEKKKTGEKGCAMAFGPGLTLETLTFS